VRYEDLIAKPQESMQPIFERLNLTWHSGCEDAVTNIVLRSHKKPNKTAATKEFIHEIEQMIHNSGDAAELMKELNYRIPGTVRIHNDGALLENLQITDLHIQNPMLQQPHQPQYLLNQQLQELQQQHLRLRKLYQQIQQQYQDIMVSKTYQLAQKIQQSWLLKLWRLVRKQH
jgi:hypothetical protein